MEPYGESNVIIDNVTPGLIRSAKHDCHALGVKQRKNVLNETFVTNYGLC